MKFNIAVGKSRKDLKWKNKQWTWEEFIERIKETHRTPETVNEYFSFKKDRQDEIKDIGGFVGGYLTGGRRLATSVTSRSIITLDADDAAPELWDLLTLQYSCAAAIYSTHKHTPDNPRIRVVIPLSREVFTDEYYAICRRIAGDIGIEMFDPTGYQPHRLMYWPSTPSDGEYIFREQKGAVLDPDDVLSTYFNWQDISEWPASLKEKKTLRDISKKQGDPFEKPGLIGAFNRAYPISEAMKIFLPGVYEESSIENRFTFKEGSTAAGVVVYDDKFSYSHHSTDPTSNILCNAFDLVRLHKFGLEDEDIADETPVNKRPSYLSMCNLVANDNLVKQQIGENKLEMARSIFEEVGETEIDLEWLKDMDVDRKGNYLFTINNIALILEHDPVFKNNVAFNDFEQQPIFKKDLPWRKIGKKPGMSDNDLANIENYIEKVYKLSCGGKLQKGLLVVLEKYRFHPVIEYIHSIKWDGKKRVDNLLTTYLGVEPNDYTRAITRKTLAAAIARVFEPGCKFDYVLTLIGDEGQGKSYLWDVLGGIWFSDTFNLHMLQSKEAYEQIQGVWIIEISELSGMMKIEVERVKGFIAARQDRYRAPWGRTTEPRLRQCIFVAGTNDFNPLKSQNGNRRFWTAATHVGTPHDSVYNITPEIRDQIWAEAYQIYLSGEKLYLDDPKIHKIALEQQNKYTEENPWTEIFNNYLETKIPANWYEMSRWDKIEFMTQSDKGETFERDKVCKYELWEIALNKKEALDTYGLRQIKQAMSKLKGWVLEHEYVRFGTSYPRHRGSYRREITLESIL